VTPSRTPAPPVTSQVSLPTPSLRRRVTLTVLILLAAMLLALAVTTDLVLGNRLDAQLRSRLVDRADVAAALVDQVSSQELVKRLEGDGVSVELRTSDGSLYTAGPLRSAPGGDPSVTAPPPRVGAPPGPAAGPKAKASEVVASGNLLTVTRQLNDGSTVRLLADATDISRTLSQLRLILLLSALLVLAVGAIVLGPVVARALRPLEQITGVARSISAGDRGRRLHPDRPDTELGRTATAFDAMLDTVEGAERHALDSEDRLRSFLSDASHELRTPLAGIHSAAEHLLRANPSRVERERVLMTAIREARRASRLVDDLLLASQIGSGLELRRSDTDLSQVARRVVDARRIGHPSSRLEVEGTSLVMPADADRIGQAIGNLVDNALHVTSGQGAVTVIVSASEAGAVVDVLDDGPGVPVPDRERIFDRLVRLDEARSSHLGGAGLGLSIARGIVRAHGGDIACLDSPTPRGHSSGSPCRDSSRSDC
jgi:two-component system OmpR family sensor kinase